jgi:anti-sigma factor RsiW
MSILDTDMATKSAKTAMVSTACRQYFVDLSAYSDGELEGDAKTAIERHLLDCEACRLRLDQMIRMRYQALRALATPGLPRGRSVLDLLKDKRDEEDRPASKDPLVS